MSEEEPSSLFSRKKGLALLAYLVSAAPGGFHRRDHLVGLLWPELDHKRARAALRKSLHFLRRSLGERIVISRGDQEIGIAPASLWCDAVAFEKALLEEDLERGLELYRGDLLPGFFLSECHEFENWLEMERTRLRDLAAGAAWRLAFRHVEEGRVTQGERCGQLAVTLLCTEEAQVQAFITALAEAGDRAAAIRFYERFETLLLDHLEISPSGHTKKLINQLRHDPSTGTIESAERQPRLSPELLPLQRPKSRKHQTTGKGKKGKTQGFRRTLWLGLGTMVTVCFVAGAYIFAVASSNTAPSDHRIAVLSPINQTGQASLDWLGNIVADWVTEALDRAEVGRPVPFLEVLFATESPGGSENARAHLQNAWPAETGADLAVVGSYYLLGDSLLFRLRLVDSRGRALAEIPPVGGDKNRVQDILEPLRLEVLSTVSEVISPGGFRLMWPKSDPPRNMAGSQALYEAASVSAREGANAAIPLFEKAAESDSTYFAPLRWLVGMYAAAGLPARGDSVCTILEGHLGEFSTQERLVTQMNCGFTRGDHWEALVRATELLEFSPLYFVRVGEHALDLNRPYEAARALAEYDPTVSQFAASYADRNYYLLALAYHWLGDHRRELRTAREGRRMFPTDRALARAEVAALIALGKEEEAREIIEESAALLPEEVSPGFFLGPAAREADEHGNPELAKELWGRILTWHEMREPTAPASHELAVERADALLSLGKPAAALNLLKGLSSGGPGDLDFQGRMAVALARLGRTQEANLLAQEIGSGDDPFDHGRSTAWRSYIAASLREDQLAVSLLHESIEEGMGFQELAPRESPFLKPLRGNPAFAEFLNPRG